MKKTILLLLTIYSVLLHAETLSLKSGWNLIGPNSNLSLEELNTSIGYENLLIIQGQQKSYKKENSLSFLNTFTAFESGKGYWIKIVNDIDITYNKITYQEEQTINLLSGWNLINPPTDLNITSILFQLDNGELEVIQGIGIGTTYKKINTTNQEEFLNSFQSFEEPKGYWVKVNQACTLTFPNNNDEEEETLVGTNYEDAEDGEIIGWTIYDETPAGASITNITDNGNRVIHVQGSGRDNGFMLGDFQDTSNKWNNTLETLLTWKMKTSSEFTIYIRIDTSIGPKFLYYDEFENDTINEEEYIHHQLGTDVSDGNWHTFTRNLAEDLDSTGNISLYAVNGFLIRGADVFLDDIILAQVDAELIAPKINLNGANPLTLTQHSIYVEKNATAIDNIDGNLSVNIHITNNINTSILGEYIVNYSVTDSDINIKEVNRTVFVVTPPSIDLEIRQSLEDSATASRNDIRYIVVGDSTRQHTSTDMLTYYQNQLNKINVNFFHTARSGLKAKYWLDGTSQRATISDTLALISQENQANYILEFSLGINDFGIGGTSEIVYNTLKSSIDTLKISRPNMKIILVSPVAHDYPGIPNVSNNLESIYLRLASEENLTLISGKTALNYVQQDFSSPETFNSDFYLDEIHPNSDALKRLLNYIFSELGGSEVHQTMTVTGSDTKTLAEIQVELPINLSEE